MVIPMYARKKCTEKFPELFQDETAVKLMEKIDYDFSELENKSKSTMQEFGFLEVAMRQNDLAWEIKNYLEEHPDASVVNLGCGPDNTGRSCDNGLCRIYNIDFPDVIAARNDLKVEKNCGHGGIFAESERLVNALTAAYQNMPDYTV